jgi:ParB family transcriptional regulator, chromosome partitioning protein
MNIKNIPLKLIDVAEENIRKDHSFGVDRNDELMTEHLSKYDLLQPVVVRFDNQSKRYKLLIGRRRFFALSAKGHREIPSVITNLEGSEAEAASLFENLIRKDLSPLERARIIKKLIESTKSGITGFSAKFGIPKSSISEWLSILKLPSELQEKIEKGEIASYEAIQIARKSKHIHTKLVAAAAGGTLQEKMAELGVKRGAPKGLLTIRLVFNPKKKLDQQIWARLNQKADQNGLEVADYARTVLAKHIK